MDLRDAVGDRLYLSKGFHRDGVSIVTTKPTPPLTLPQDSIRCKSSDITQVCLFPSFPTHYLLTISHLTHAENTQRPSQPAKQSHNPANPVVFSPSFEVAHPPTDRHTTTKGTGPRVGCMGHLRSRKSRVCAYQNVTSVSHWLTGYVVLRSKFTRDHRRAWVCQCSACGS